MRCNAAFFASAGAALILLTLGCNRGPAVVALKRNITLTEAREACGHHDDDRGFASDDGSTLFYETSSGCSSALGLAIGMDWDSFGDEPRTFEIAQRDTELVVGGLHSVVVGEHGQLQGLCGDPVLPAWIVDEYCEDPEASGARVGAELWWAMMLDAIDRTVDADEVSSATLSYLDGTVYVGSVDIATSLQTPVRYAAGLVHEANHIDGRNPHVPCPTSDGLEVEARCDDGTDGAFGVQALMLATWLNDIQYEGSYQYDNLAFYIGMELTVMCGMIYSSEREGFWPCEDYLQ